MFLAMTAIFFAHALVYAEPPVLKPAQSYVEVLNGNAVTSLAIAYRVPTARVLIADYALIRKDFPQTHAMTNAEIDQWLLDQSGYLAKGQIELGEKAGVNSEISYDPKDRKDVLRPPQYDRALVFEAQGGGLIDGKGFGASAPRLDSHANGLMETYQSVREYLYTKATKAIFKHADAAYNVVDAYAVIDWGFDVHEYGESGKSYRAGAILRQAHVRDLTDEVTAQGQLPRRETEAVERILRNYGMTSGATRSLGADTPIEALNVQGTRDRRFIYDFGSFHVEDHFKNPAFMIKDYALHGREIARDPAKYVVFDPKNPFYPEPDDRLKLSYAEWTGSSQRSEEAIRKKIQGITEKLDHGKSLPEVRGELQALLKNEVTLPAAHWAQIPAHVHIDGCNTLLKTLFPN